MVALKNKITNLEGEMRKINVQFVMKDHVISTLRHEVVKLQQYTRIYSVIVTGIEKKHNEKHNDLTREVESLVKESTADISMADVDKFHRNSPIKVNRQELIVRFKSHSSKEAFLELEKTLSVKV